MTMTKKSSRKKIEIDFIEEEKSDIKFCTECGEALEDFSVSDESKDLDAVIKNFHNCKKTGKFKGDVCSKLYMISPPPEDTD